MSEEIEQDENSSKEEQSPQKISEPKKLKKVSSKNKSKIVLNISDCQYPVVSRVAKSLGWKLQASSECPDWDVFWTDNAVQPQILLKMQPYQKINHFPGMFNLARKNLMGRYLMKMRKKFPVDYNFFPMTWMLPVQYHDLKTYYESKTKGKARTFIVKPEALSQGKGIYLTRKLEQIDQTAHCVVQRYMHKPYLIEGLKFDLRVYVLVASVDPLRLYIYYQGLTRFATEKYEPPTKDNMDDVCMHLTNYAINKDNPKFVFNSSSTDMTKGHKRSLTWLLQYLAEKQQNGKNLKQKIQDMIVKTMISGLPVISNTYRSCQPQNYSSNMCFELLGFDVMLTDKCEPVLLEINHTPSFTTDTPLDDLIKTNYIKDSLLLMNINQKTKQSIIKQRREACQQRVITGKKIKLTNQQKQMERSKAQAQREKYEKKHLGGFKKIYPLDDDQQKMLKYKQLLEFSQQTYLISTGTKKGSSITKKSEKIESAFGTSFKPKDTTKTSHSIKNRETIIDLKRIKKIEKIDGNKTGKNTSIEKEKKKLTHSENLISPKSLGFVGDIQILEKKDMQLEKSYSQQGQGQSKADTSHNRYQSIKEDYNSEAIQQQSKQNMKTHSQDQSKQRSRRLYLSKTSNKQLKVKQTQQGEQETLQSNKIDLFGRKEAQGMNKFDETKNNKIKYNLNFIGKASHSPKQVNHKNLNNVEIMFETDGYPNNFGLKKGQQPTLSNSNQQNLRNNDFMKMGMFSVNHINCQDDKKKIKNPSYSTNTKTTSQIQAWDSKTKQKHTTNREKIPILLNTLLIGASQKPGVSANNLRKIINIPTK